MRPVVTFEGVWKKFRTGERHDSLKDLISALVTGRIRTSAAASVESGEFWVLRDVSFESSPGECLAIIGPNGAGKSTALKLLTRILKPTRGQCAVQGRVGALIEVAAGFHPDLTGRENVFLQGAIMGMHQPEIQARLEEIVEFSGVGAFLDTPLKRYSSGMAARLGFSVAAHLDPDVLFVDEVLSVGDISFQTRCLDKMREKIANGTSVIFVSHNLQAVASLCTRAIVLGGGQKLFDGPPARALDVYLEACRDHSRRFGADTERFVVENVEFSRSQGRVGDALVPHEPCRLQLTVRCLKESPPFTVGVEFERTRDLLYCYGVSSEDLGVPNPAVQVGDVHTIVIDFVAHFARGHYRINVNLRDTKAGRFLMFAESLVNFSVDEPRAFDGVVDVQPAIAIIPGTDAAKPEVVDVAQ